MSHPSKSRRLLFPKVNSFGLELISVILCIASYSFLLLSSFDLVILSTLLFVKSMKKILGLLFSR